MKAQKRYTIEKQTSGANDKMYIVRDTETKNEYGVPTVVQKFYFKKDAVKFVKEQK